MEKALTNASSCGKHQIILDMPNWPYVDVLPDTPGQKALLKSHRDFWLGLSKWLQLYELGNAELLPDLLFGTFKTWRPYADLSVAKLRFAEQVYPKLASLKEIAPTSENLWGQFEYFDSLRNLKAGGFYDAKPLTDDKGKVKSKTTAHKEITYNIRDVRDALGQGSWEDLVDNWPYRSQWENLEDWREYLHSVVLHNAVIYAERNDDDELRSHCFQMLDALKKFERLTNKQEGAKNYQFPHLLSLTGEVQFTGKSKKAPTSKGFDKKRTKGRPPKGSNVKKY